MKKQLTIKYDAVKDWWIVTFPGGKIRNYASLNTLINVIKDYWNLK